MAVLEKINSLVWGIPTLVLILGMGILIAVLTGCIQLRRFPQALRTFGEKLFGAGGDGVSSYRALCTALAATVGTGNLAGVAGAIAIGGPGAIFWMWICGILGMGIKFTEAALAVRYRIRLPNGEYAGGPMYMMETGMKHGYILGCIYSFFGVVASLGVGNATQINTVVQGIHSTAHSFGFRLPDWFDIMAGITLAGVVMYLFQGGAGRIGRSAEVLVPAAAVCYILLCIMALGRCGDQIPRAFQQIVRGAFSPRAVTGGTIGSILITLRIGISRGIFTNEAGMGTAGIAHAGAQVKHPWEQGYMGIMEVFLDTIVICTMTALVILCAPIEIQYGTDTGVMLTLKAFESIFGAWVKIPLTVFLCLFAFATVLGWGLYGLRCAQFLFGDVSRKWCVILQGGAVAASAVLACDTVWLISEIINGCMAIPNLMALFALRKELVRIVNECPAKSSGGFAGHGKAGSGVG